MTIISIKLNKIKIVDIINNIKGILLLEAVLLLFKPSKESEFSIFIFLIFLIFILQKLNKIIFLK